MHQSHSDILILGAGMAGLSAAYQAQKKGFRVCVLESSNRVGGVIRSEWRDGFLLEHGPNTIMPNKDVFEMVQSLGLEKEMVLAEPKTPRYILKNGHLFSLPLSLSSFLKTSLLSPFGKLRILMEPFISNQNGAEDENLGDFFKRRLGKEATECLAKPFISGVYAGDAHQLSALSTFPRLVHWEKEKGSIIKGALAERKKKKAQNTFPKGLLSFVSGLETLPQALRKQLNDLIQTNQMVKKIEFKDKWFVLTDKGVYTGNRLLIALPTYQTAPLLRDFLPIVSKTLNTIPYVPIIVLHLSLEKKNITHSLNGFGYLCCPKDKKNVLGCLWNSSLYENRAPQDQALLTVFLGGASHSEIIKSSDEDILQMATQELKPVLGLKEVPRKIGLTRIPKAIPQYTLGHVHREEILKKAEKEHTGLHFIGNYRSGVSVGDVVQTAMAVV